MKLIHNIGKQRYNEKKVLHKKKKQYKKIDDISDCLKEEPDVSEALFTSIKDSVKTDEQILLLS